MLKLDASVETWTLARPFRIARGVRTQSELLYVRLTDADGNSGQGEGAPIVRYKVTAAEGLAQIEALRAVIESGACDRQALQGAMPAGAARNAVDSALWDLEARQQGTTVAAMAGTDVSQPLRTAETVGIATPEEMAEAARVISGPGRLIKIKLDSEAIAARISAIRTAAPEARLVIDANEGWSLSDVMDHRQLLADAGVEMLEQPLPAGRDEELLAYDGTVPLSADESCHVAADVARLKDIYSIVNIKLDKTGGLTEGLKLEAAAREAGLGIMVGCMIGTSLGMAPGAIIARGAKFTDLDGPTWLAEDRADGFTFDKGLMTGGRLWGG